MADSTTTTGPSNAPRQRPGGHHHGPPNHNRGRGSSGRGYRGQREGRGGRGGAANTIAPSIDGEIRTNLSEPPGSPPNGGFGARLTKAASQIQGDLGMQDSEVQVKTAEQEDSEGEICFICASTIEHTSISPCNHQTCHICALRLRALYKTKACAHCRTEADYVIFTDSMDQRYEDFADQTFARVDENLGIKFEKDAILDDTILLLRYNCPNKDCDIQCLSWPDLHRHVRGKHGKVMCDLCTRNKKVFTHEHELFTYGELRRHERFGDDNPGAIDQSGFKGHPECGFCKQRFYGDDELYTHCRERHERCHICDRRNQGSHPQYYLNYQELEKHFELAHFVCLDAECQANKTNVFESEMDLKAHQLSEHPNGLSKDARRDARLVNLSGFELRTPYQPERRGARDHRGGARGRDPNADPLPASSAQPIGRAELAYQRQMALMTAPTSSGRSFGGQLTQTPVSPRQQTQPPTRGNHTAPARAPQPPNLDTLTISDDSTTNTEIPQTPHEQARAARHTAVTSRATSLFAAPTPASTTDQKLNTFRTLISQYRTSTLSASELLSQFTQTLFPIPPTPPSELGKLVRELADLFESEPKRQSLLESWHNWRNINDASDYPSLPGFGPSSSSTPGTLGGRRVLKLKSSTAKSGRSAANRQGAWGGQSVAAGSALSGNPFPTLPGSSTGAAGKKGNATAAAWGAKPTPSNPTSAAPQPQSSVSGAGTAVSSSVSSFRPSNNTTTTTTPRSTGTRPQNNNEEMFPSLPATVKPSVLMAGLTRGTVRWDGRTSGPNSGSATPVAAAWGGNPTPAQASAALNAVVTNGQNGVAGTMVDDDSGAGGPKKKGRKKEKQVLYHFG